MPKSWRVILFLLTLVVSTLWLAVIFYPGQNFRLIACDVGQGDAILAIYGSTQLLVDGGPGSKVLDCLTKYMPFWDREIEVVILTHPQKDHYAGLIDVFKRYQVQTFIATPLEASSQDYKVLKSQVGGRGIKVINPTSGMKVRFGLIRLDIFWPSQEFLSTNLSRKGIEDSDVIFSANPDVATYSTSEIEEAETLGNGVLGVYTSEKDLNEFSVVAILSFKNFDALLTGDIDPEISDRIAKSLAANSLQPIEYIKVPHHGSKNGLTRNLLEAVKPKMAIISAGKNNSYGHPHKEVLDMLFEYRLKVLRTDELGDIILNTDGEEFWIRK